MWTYPETLRWERRVPIWDQGGIGSCTGHAMAGLIGTDGLGRTGRDDVTDALALELYERATALDPFPGSWPAQDTGSTTVAVAEAAMQLGLITSYRHTRTVYGALDALRYGPCLFGLPWFSSCEEPRARGQIPYTGHPYGGHEVVLVGFEPGEQMFVFANSRGPAWGDGGFFRMSYRDVSHALWIGGEVVRPTFPRSET